MTDWIISNMLPSDWPAVEIIYREGIATGHATFETGTPGWKDWDEGHLPIARLVARRNGSIVGWAALSRVSSRTAYAGVAEVSIYVAAAERGAGIGKSLMQAVIAASEANGIWMLQAAVFPENSATIALHRGCGFREVGRRERISRLDGVWRDTLLLERRSTLVGVVAE